MIASLVVAALAIGLTGVIVVFSLADAILWHPLPFRGPERLVALWSASGEPQTLLPFVRLAELDAWTTKDQVFSAVYSYGTGGFTVSGRGDAQSVSGAPISHGLFAALGVAPRTGRDLVQDDFAAGAEPVVVLSDHLSRTQFGERARPLGEWLKIDDRPFRVVGVMPPDFSFPYTNVQFWIPITTQPKTSDRYYAVGRIRDGTSAATASAAVETLTRGLRDAAGRPLASLRVRPFTRRLPQTDLVLWILAGVVGLILAIAVANAANLLVADAVEREHEIATRAAIGASALRLARQLLVEAAVLVTAAVVVGMIAAAAVVEMVAAALPRVMSFQSLRPIAVDWRSAVAAVAIAAPVTIAVALLPIWRLRHLVCGAARRGEGDRVSGERIRSMLVAGQVALTIVVVVAAGLLARGFVTLQHAHLGFDPDNLLAVAVQLRGDAFRSDEAKQRFLEEWRRSAAALPGVVDATVAESLPPRLGFVAGPIETVDGRSVANGAMIAQATIDDGFLRTLRIPLLRGTVPNGPLPADGRHHVVVSRSFAEMAWPGRDPIAEPFRLSLDTVVYVVDGVAGDVLNGSVDSPLGTLALYERRTSQASVWQFQSLILRTSGSTQPIARAVRDLVRRLNPNVPIQVSTAHELILDVNARLRFATWLMLGFGAIATTLALIGVLGAFSCSVRQRRREIAVRIALGAQSSDVIRMVLRSSALCALAGLALGLPAAFAAARALRSLLFEISPSDPATFAAVSVASLGAALVASWVPASRASRFDPAETLRAE